MKSLKEEYKVVLLFILILVLIDQIIKIFLIKSNFQFISKSGLGIGLGEFEKSKDNINYILISFLIAIVLIRYIKSNNTYIKLSNKIIVSTSIAGIITNLIDRLYKGCVINYIKIPNLLDLNLGYIYILITWIGMAVILTIDTMNHFKNKEQKDVENGTDKS